jgi:hypothetical protein
MARSLEVKTVGKSNFSKYGVILEHVNQIDGYEPLVKVDSRGWIWAILTFNNRTIERIEHHPASKESFEPVFGTAMILVAPAGHPDNVELFLLDKAVMLHEGIWHQVMSLSEVSRVKITENSDVTAEYYELGYSVAAALVCIQKHEQEPLPNL